MWRARRTPQSEIELLRADVAVRNRARISQPTLARRTGIPALHASVTEIDASDVQVSGKRKQPCSPSLGTSSGGLD